MPQRDDDPLARSNGRAVAALRRVADALGHPAEAFLYKSEPMNTIGDTSELLGLWARLPDPEARQRILVQLRSEVDRDR